MSRLQKVLIAVVVVAAILFLDVGGIRTDILDGARAGFNASRPAADSTR